MTFSFRSHDGQRAYGWLVLLTTLTVLSSGVLSSCAPSTKLPTQNAYGEQALVAPNLPADGRILWLMGQDSETLAAYKAEALDADPDLPRPGGVTLYTGISTGPEEDVLLGLYEAVDYGAGTISFTETLEAYPEAALAIGLALTDPGGATPTAALQAIAGFEDAGVTADDVARARAHVEALIDYLIEIDRDVFLRIGYEFDGPWNGYQPAPYKSAFRYIAERLDAREADRVATVWQSAAAPMQDPPYRPSDTVHFETWYPGDDAVDWVGLSVFTPWSVDENPWGCLDPEAGALHPARVRDRIFAFARARDKPVMIGEAAPQGFETDVPTAGCWSVRAPQPVAVEEVWATWYVPFFDLVEENRDVVRAIAYINTDWNGQAMWQCAEGAPAGDPTCPSGYWGDSRVQGHPEILRRFKQELQTPLYVNGAASP